MKYRKKPVVIEAYQTDKELDIETLEGTMHASVGDYIITGVRGEQYPCKPDIFEQTYEPADAPTASPWHRVEEPPKVGQIVLTMDADEDMETAIYDGEVFEDSYGFYITNVLYWMPIEPPEEENE